MRVGWRGHSDQKSSDALKGGWGPDEAGGHCRLERDFICYGCPQGSAAYGMNFSSNHRECNMSDRKASQVSRKSRGKRIAARRGGPDSGSDSMYVLVLERTHIHIYADVDAITIILAKVLGEGALGVNCTSTAATKTSSYFHSKRLVLHQSLAHWHAHWHSVGCGF